MTYPPPGNSDPFGQQPAQDPYAQQQPPAPQYGQPYAQQQPYGQPYAQQQPYGQPYAQQYPAYGAPMTDPNKQNGLAIGAMSTGIASIVLACCGVVGGIAGVAAIVLSILANKQISERGGRGKGMALTGIITGAVGIVIAIGLLIWILSGGQQSLMKEMLT
jgi:hypothetical protein